MLVEAAIPHRQRGPPLVLSDPLALLAGRSFRLFRRPEFHEGCLGLLGPVVVRGGSPHACEQAESDKAESVNRHQSLFWPDKRVFSLHSTFLKQACQKRIPGDHANVVIQLHERRTKRGDTYVILRHTAFAKWTGLLTLLFPLFGHQPFARSCGAGRNASSRSCRTPS